MAQRRVVQEVAEVREVLTEYLTNNGSEWLDEMLRGGMSFSEFRDLDVNRLRWAADELLAWAQLVELDWTKNAKCEAPEELFLVLRDVLKMKTPIQ